MTTQVLIDHWRAALQEAKAAKSIIEREQKLRALVFEAVFPGASEGVNRFILPDGWMVKATHKLDRAIDEPALEAVVYAMNTKFDIDGYALVRYKPTLNTKLYKELSDEQKKVFDEALIIKPAAPVLELIEPLE